MKISVFSIKQREVRLTTGRNGYLSSFAKALNHLFFSKSECISDIDYIKGDQSI